MDAWGWVKPLRTRPAVMRHQPSICMLQHTQWRQASPPENKNTNITPHRSARRNRPSRTAPQMALRRAPGAVSRLLWGSSSTSFGSSSDGAHRSAFAGCRCERSTAAPQTVHEHARHSTQCHVNRATFVTQSTLHRCCCHTRTCTSTSTHVHSKYPRYIPTPRSCEWATCRTQACPSSVARGQSC